MQQINRTETRLRIPLMLLRDAGPVQGMARLHMLTCLTQRELEKEEYEFAHMPYSDGLAKDIESNIRPFCLHMGSDDEGAGSKALAELMSSKEMIIEVVRFDKYRRWCEYYLTNTGKNWLAEHPMDADMSQRAAACIKKYDGLKTVDLLKEAYSKPIPNGNDLLKMLEAKINSIALNEANLEKAIRPEIAIPILACKETVQEILEEMNKVKASDGKKFDHTDKVIIANMSMAIMDKSTSVSLNNPSDYFDSGVSEIEELEWLLLEYCDSKNIIKNPHRIPLEERVDKEEMRLALESLKKSFSGESSAS